MLEPKAVLCTCRARTHDEHPLLLLPLHCLAHIEPGLRPLRLNRWSCFVWHGRCNALDIKHPEYLNDDERDIQELLMRLRRAIVLLVSTHHHGVNCQNIWDLVVIAAVCILGSPAEPD